MKSYEARYMAWLLAVGGSYDARRLAAVTDGGPQWSPADFALLRAREVAGLLIAGEPLPDRDQKRAEKLSAGTGHAL